MEGIVKNTEDGKLFVKLRKGCYEKAAVMGAANKATDKCTVLVEPIGDNHIGVYFEPNKDKHVDLEQVARRFTNDALDLQTRLDIQKTTGKIRDLIVEHAFKPIRNLQERL